MLEEFNTGYWKFTACVAKQLEWFGNVWGELSSPTVSKQLSPLFREHVTFRV